MTAPVLTGLIIWGASGHAKVVVNALSSLHLCLLVFFDNNHTALAPIRDIPIYYGEAGFKNWLLGITAPERLGFAVAIGGSKGTERLQLQEFISAAGLVPLIIRHGSAFIDDSAQLDAGTQILAQAAVCADSRLGKACIVNTTASVDHDCVVGSGVHFCPGARVAGCVTVDNFATIGTGAVILPRLHIGEHAIVGAGSVVIEDVPAYAVVAGNPARIIGKNEHGRKRHGL